MRFLRAAKLWLLVAAGIAACAACAAFRRAPVFEGGYGYEFYLGESSSAQIVRTPSPALQKLFLCGVRGESVRYEGDVSQELLSRFRAEVVFSEEADGVLNLYCRSPLLREEIALCGHAVNLHIAVGRGQTAAGTPLIFGGF